MKITHIPAPQIDLMLYQIQQHPAVLDDKTKHLITTVFQKMQDITNHGDDERRELWIPADRGTIEDFGDFEEYLTEGEVSSQDEFEELWLSEYPDCIKWYKLTTTIYENTRYVFFDNKLTFEVRPVLQNNDTKDHSELAEWLLSAVDDCLTALEKGAYNAFVEDHFPYRKRIGKILRKDFWYIFPDEKAAYLNDITPEKMDTFFNLIQRQAPDSPAKRLPEMTRRLFLDSCRLGYAANHYAGTGTLSSMELYRSHADGRDDGLLDINEDSPEDFAAWYHDARVRSGHPWEVCRGGNSTHISLYARCDNRGWWFTLAGSSYSRSVETVKFYLALNGHGIPVFLCDGQELAAMLAGKDYIGIVPEEVIPSYCGHLFPDENIIDFMHLPCDHTKAIIEAVTWHPLDRVTFN